MIHIVFNTADVAVLQQAIEMDASLQGEVLQVHDDFAVGPLSDIYLGEGMLNRRNWWRQVLAGGDYEGNIDDASKDDVQQVASLVGNLRRNPDEIIWIWAAQNKHDAVSYTHLDVYKRQLFRVRNKQETIYCYDEAEKQAAVRKLGNKPEITRFKGLGEISPDEFARFIGTEMKKQSLMIEQGEHIQNLLEYYICLLYTSRCV